MSSPKNPDDEFQHEQTTSHTTRQSFLEVQSTSSTLMFETIFFNDLSALNKSRLEAAHSSLLNYFQFSKISVNFHSYFKYF